MFAQSTRIKLFFSFDLKQFRLGKYSKEIEVLQTDLELIDRVLQEVILSQYRRKVVEKHKVSLKPVIFLNPKLLRNRKKFSMDF